MSELEIQPERVLTAMVTPFKEDGRINPEGVAELSDYLMNHGSDGLVIAGTTGESPTIDIDEHLGLFDEVRFSVPDAFIMAGTGSNYTDHAAEMTYNATERGSVNAILAVSPYYNRPSQEGIKHYYETLRRNTDLPIILYNIPVRTGRLVELDTVRELFEAGAIDGVKDATGNTEMAEELVDEFGEDIVIFSGDDSLNLDFALAGADGSISVMSHWAGEAMQEMYKALDAGDLDRAKQIQDALSGSADYESVHTDTEGNFRDVPNPIPTKVMMSQILGRHVVGEAKPPMIATAENRKYLEMRAPQVLAELATAMSAIRA